MTKWTHFWDMHSGGRTKIEPYNHIFIELPEKEAISAFYSRFNRNPNRITCTCCGSDYSISEYDSLERATSFFRNVEIQEDGTEKPRNNYFGNGKPRTMDELKAEKDFLFICEEDARKEDTTYEPPEEGWVWQ